MQVDGGIVAVRAARDVLSPFGSPAVVLRPLPGRARRRHEAVMWNQLLRECETGTLGKLARPVIFPKSEDQANARPDCRSVCAYDKKGAQAVLSARCAVAVV